VSVQTLAGLLFNLLVFVIMIILEEKWMYLKALRHCCDPSFCSLVGEANVL